MEDVRGKKGSRFDKVPNGSVRDMMATEFGGRGTKQGQKKNLIRSNPARAEQDEGKGRGGGRRKGKQES